MVRARAGGPTPCGLLLMGGCTAALGIHSRWVRLRPVGPQRAAGGLCWRELDRGTAGKRELGGPRSALLLACAGNYYDRAVRACEEPSQEEEEDCLRLGCQVGGGEEVHGCNC